MKAIQIERTGGPEVLTYRDVPTPTVGPGDVLVKAHAIGVNMPEVLVRRGTYGWMPPLPAIPGIEMSGVMHTFDDDPGSRRGATVALLGMLSAGAIRPPIQELVPLAEAGRA
jgi:NADPH:quinone reductase-like Zn-dependent oxidoreductase